MTGTSTEHARRQAGASDDAGMPGAWRFLFALLGPPVAWSLHLLASYTLQAWACSAGWSGLRSALVLLSVAAVAVSAWSAVLARRQWHVARDVDRPIDDAWDARMGEQTARVSFFMVVALFNAALFALGIVYAAIAPFLVPSCQSGVGS